ncbi:MAG: 3-oxoacyl-[acyl-carrier-protein] reductase [bacterium]|nr:3-oxoacyl-[acyl-carrier-protein] reductase [bacterium]
MCERILVNQVAIVTGGARGIGRAICEALAEEGANIVVVDINLDQANETDQALTKQFDVQTLSLQVNVADISQVEKMVKNVLDKFGKINILINNAGITRDTFLIRMSPEDFKAVLDVNLTGTFNCTKEIAKIMVKQRTGKIVNISSTVGIQGNIGQVNYSASKAGVIGLTKSAARELAKRGINVNAVAPGFIETEMTAKLADEIKKEYLEKIPLERYGKPQDIAQAVKFLVSPDANYITGQVIVVDGGMAM